MPQNLLTLFAATISCVCLSSAVAQESEKPSDPVSLILITEDLNGAKRAMTIYDLDEDGFVDKHELKRIPWHAAAEPFDLNHDGKLTHLEIAVYYAKLRDDVGIEGIDVNSAKTKLARHDKNQNGQLDPDEIENGWPRDTTEYDFDHDGTITLGELTRHFAFHRGLRRTLGIEGVDHTGAGRLLERFDSNRNGKLDADESAKTYLPRPRADFDENSDGQLTIVELETMLSRQRLELGLTRTDQQKINGLFRRYDANADGKIMESEMQTLFGESEKSELVQFDTTQDGVVTVDEVEQSFADARRKMGYTEEDYSKAFKQVRRHDTNHNKSIETNELFNAPTTGQLSTSLIGLADENADSKLSISELARYFAKKRKAQELGQSPTK